jgi:ABC-type molybdenum transport system ATPase subunit/photorepair protein PhrA
MEKVVVALFKGEDWRLVGLSIRNEESIEDLRKLIKVVEESLQKNFPSTPIVRRKAVRELFGERK